MSWDWDKLQEKRKRQNTQPPRREDHDEPDDSFHEGDSGRNENRNSGSGGGGNGGRGKFPNGPSMNNLGAGLKKIKEKKFFSIKKLLIVVVLVWFASGFFIVGAGEQAVVLVFGKAQKENYKPGAHYRWPYPIGEDVIVNTSQLRIIEIGFRSTTSRAGKGSSVPIDSEAAILTSDENIAMVPFVVQYYITNLYDFLYNTDMQVRRTRDGLSFTSETVKSAAIAAMRETIGSNPIDAAISGQKLKIQDEAKQTLENILTRYNSGINVHLVMLLNVSPPEQVRAAFDDVTSAREDKNRLINEAEAYRNDIIPKARGDAAKILNDAQGYSILVQQKALGESQKFLSILKEFNESKDITTKRLYLETMEEVLSNPDAEKIIVGGEVGGNVLPLLPLSGNQNTVQGAK